MLKPIDINETKGAEMPKMLDDFRITSKSKIPPNVYITKVNNINKFSKGNISCWTGRAKSKKTFAMTMFISSVLSGANLYDTFFSYNRNKVIWIDTEQSPSDVQKVVKRINKLAGGEDKLFMYGLRPLSPKERVLKIEEALQTIDCDVLVIDGARDLIMNINDPTESTEIVTLLMKWSYDYNIHISTVVHMSSADKVRGHIGTEIENKSETVIKVTKSDGKGHANISTIEETYGRGKGFENIAFYIDDNGLPVVNDDYMEESGFNLRDENNMPF